MQRVLLVLLLVGAARSYLVVVHERHQPGHLVFNAGVPSLGANRHYAINTHRSAAFVAKLIHVDPKRGYVSLKQPLDCAGVYYPSLFTLYVDSLSNQSRGVDFYSMPLRVFVAGPKCADKEHNDIHGKISEAKRWVSETYLSYAIPGTESWKKICLRRSQLLNSVAAMLPEAVSGEGCRVKYVDVSDPRFRVEGVGGDLVSADDQCIVEPLWKVTVLVELQCTHDYSDGGLVSDVEHRLKIVYHHQELNDTDIARRVRRELRNQSPYFEQALYVASVMEERAPGAPVTTVRARDPENSPVTYSMVSLLDSRSQGMFSIDAKSGAVTTNSRLDRELVDVHYFHLTATDDSFPPRSGTTTLQVNVLDANDHAPAFESAEYDASVRESVTVGSTVATLRATDQDIGRNAEIEYTIVKQAAGGGAEVPDAFRIDAKSGVISTQLALDREQAEVYTVLVQAADQAKPIGERKSATATLVVRVLDDNDNYPQFTERTYSVNVPEDVDWSTNPVIATVKATDLDAGSNAVLRYAIISGNTQSQFNIDSSTGDVTLVKPLDYETLRRYRLVVRAQDGGSPSRSNTTQLLVNVMDVNDNAPRFYTSLFQESVSENVPSGYSIVRVQAYDADEGENANIRYALAERDGSGGATSDLPLTVDERSGWIHTTRELDREHHARYQLQVVATDSGSPPRSAVASVVVTVQDVNDNDPVFEPREYEAVVSEDDPPGTPVASVTASDRDENPRLHYELTGGNLRGRFAITSQNGQGLITVAQPLDYKQEKRFVLTVTASDSGRRQDTATVFVNVSDANNYAPVFENAPYSVSVFEDAPIGTTVVVVEATDGDVGINAQITYSLGSNDETSSSEFEINAQTGAVVTKRLLDREQVAGYQLTVTARDGGSPSHADTTDVEITVTDVNDSPPEFKKQGYAGSVPEDALVGTSVLQISASDQDMGLNGRLRYALSSDAVSDGSFVVDPTSGVVRTAKMLDRESVAQFKLTAYAIDRGSPALTGTVELIVNVEDINDSPPAFASDKMVMYIAENSPIGTTVGEILARDPDEGPNAVVQYSIIGGEDSNSFSLVTRPGSDKAELLTMVELDYESPRKRYELVVRAASPPLRADAHIEVMVTDVNDNAPSLKDFQVTFNNFRSCFPTGPFGRIPASDADVSDQLRYRILSGNNANLVTLNQTSGALTLSPQLNTNVHKLATMEVSVSDGVNEVKASMQLTVRMVTDEMLFNSITVRLDDMTAEAFLSPLMTFFVEGLAAILPCPRENIFIFSVQDDTDVTSKILNVSFSARRPELDGPEFYSPQFLQERVYLNRAILARLATVQVLPFDDNLCVREPCLNYEQCLTVLKFGNATGFVHSDTVLFRPIYPVTTFACRCPHGFTGNREHYLCDTEVNLCYSNPCGNHGECKSREGGYTCVCQPGFTGGNCEIDLELDTCQPGICRSGSVCSPLVRGGFRCENCSPHGGREHYTPLCELRARSFTRAAFLTFPALRQRHRLHIKLRFATQARHGMLLYNGRYNEKHDFVALEIVDGDIRFSFSLGSVVTTTVARTPGGVSDGAWHSVTVQYFNKSATVSLDDCDVALSLKHGATLGARWQCANRTSRVLDTRCSVLTETCHRYLDLTGPMMLGGLPALPTSFQVHSKDYVGCIADLYIDHAFVDLNSYVADNGTVAGCPERTSYCTSSPCKNGGTCTNAWGAYLCACPEGFSARDCSEEVPRPWRFQGDGALSFNPMLRPIQLPWVNALSVRTLQRDAFLMSVQVGQNSSATLSLVGGEVQYVVNGDTLRLPHAMVADGTWHRIEVKWMATEVWLSLDYGQREASSPAPATKLQGLYPGKILIGGPDSTAGSLGSEFDFFEGCIQDVKVGSATSALQRPTVRENVGEGCQATDQCLLGDNKCPTHSDCVSDWEQFTCRCHPGHVGTTCVPVCSVSPCEHSAPCVADPPGSYSCACDAAQHAGRHCEADSAQPCPSSWWGRPVCGPCKCDVERGYNADCNKTDGKCSCKENHYQPAGGTGCTPCDCYATGSFSTGCDRLTGQCKCRSGVIGQRCDACPNPYAEVTLRGCEVIYDGCPRSRASELWWPRTKFGQTAVEPCPARSHGRAARSCDNALGGWQTPDMFNCTSDAFLDLRKVLSQLESHELEVNTFTAVKVAGDLRRATNATASLRGADVLVAQRLLRELLRHESAQAGLNLTHAQDKDYVGNVVRTASVLLDERYEEQWGGVHRLTGATAELLVLAMQRYLGTLASSQRDTYTSPFETTAGNLALGLDVVTAESLYGYEAGGRQGEKVVLPDTSQFLQPPAHASGLPGPTVSFPKYNNYLLSRDKFDTWSRLLVPLSVLRLPAPPGPGTVTTERQRTGSAVVAYAQHRAAGDLMPARYDATVARRWGVDVKVGSPVVSVAIQVQDKDGSPTLLTGPLDHAVLLRLWLDLEEDAVSAARVNPQCVHWSEERGAWSRAGCSTQLPEAYRASVTEAYLVNCTCARLATFAVLVDVVDAQYIPEPSLLEDIVSWAAFCLALPMLLATLLVLALLRGIQTNSNTIHKNVVVCVFLAELVFFVALKARASLTQIEFPCKLIAMALHYLWLTAFTWTLVDSVHLYRMLSEMRDINHGPMRFYYTVGYGLPAIVVGLAVGVRADQYGNFYFCWLSIYEAVVWSMVGPVVVAVALNLAVLACAVRAAFTLKDHVMGFGNLRTLLWLSVVQLPLLGTVWVLAVLSVSERLPLLSHLLSAAVVAHAAFALVGYCFVNARVRRNLRYSVLRCLGRKAPLDASDNASSVQGNVTGTQSRSALAYHGAGTAAGFEAARRHIGISTSSTTSRSTTKTGSSPYRSDTHLRHTSTSTSNYTSDQQPDYQPRHLHRHREVEERVRHESDSDSEVSVDGRSLELASSHSSDDDESSARRRTRHQHSGGAPSYLPNICEDPAPGSSPRLAPALPPPTLNIINKAQLFPNLKPMYAPRWSSQLPDAYLPTMLEGSVGRGSQWSGTASDNETTSPHDVGHRTSANNYHENNFSELSDALADKIPPDKYLFPYTAEEDHCGGGPPGGVGGFILPLSGRILASSELANLRASPSPLLYPGAMVPTSAISESEKDMSETPV